MDKVWDETGLIDISIDIIKQNQHESGAYVASPTFPNYAYCWLRDGTFIAYAMDLVGEHASARAFHLWVNRVIGANLNRLERAIEVRSRGENVNPVDMMPTRYALDGGHDGTDWPSFQLDGYGTWLWGVTQHLRLNGAKRGGKGSELSGHQREASVLGPFTDSVLATCRYVEAYWDVPNYDCWEEHGDRIHTSTLACLFGGLSSVGKALGRRDLEQAAARIKRYVLSRLTRGERLVKDSGSDEPEASTLWAIVPFGMLAPDDPVAVGTVKSIEEVLVGGGVRRYPSDTYYGGGEWVILAAWLGWYYVLIGMPQRAREFLRWIVARANDRGELPEQVPSNLNCPRFYQTWVNRWGNIAQPLLWSHAMYLVLAKALEKGG